MDILEKLKTAFRNGTALTQLIFINVGVFVLLQTVLIVFRLFNVPADFIVGYLTLPADLSALLLRPWSVLSYMFLHEEFFHILFNMFALYWFGKLFLMFHNEKQLIGLYLVGGLVGAAVYVAAFNLFPYFQPVVPVSVVLGASGSIMAIIVATAIQSPNMEMRIMFIGNVKLKYIAIIAVLMSFFGVTSNNAGGEIVHLGGALAGYIFIVSLRQGKDFTAGISKVLDLFSNLFKPRKLKVKPNKSRSNGKMSDAEFNVNKARRMEDIDRILDKIKTSGYDSLSSEEKKRLFEQGKN